MYIGVSLFVIAVGAILTFAVTTSAEGFNINSAGWILMIVGAIGIVVSFIWQHSLADRWSREPPPR